MFKEKGYKIYVAAKNDFGANMPCIPNCDVFYDIPFERNPLSIDNIKAYKILKKIIDDEKFDIIECNTPVGGVLGRLAARHTRKTGTKVIYIAHGFHFFKGSGILSWLVYYPIEKLLSYITDTLITINGEDYKIAKKKLHAKKTLLFNGIGCDIKKIEACVSDRSTVRKKIGIADDDIMLLSVGELIERKNHKTMLRVLSKINNPAVHYVIAGGGVLEKELKRIAKEMGIASNVHFLGFCTDIPQILKAADIFCFPSYQEGLPVALAEAMAAQLPVVASKIRGNTDLMVCEKGGYLCEADDVDGFAEKVKKLINNPDLRKSMGQFNRSLIKKYDLESVKEKMSSVFFEEV